MMKEILLKETIDGLDAKELLLSVDRVGIPELVKFLEEDGYFKAKAAKKHHCNYEGGLVHHSLSVYSLFKEMVTKFNLDLSNESIILVSLLHDLCKVNHNYNEGHALVSLDIIGKFIELTDTEYDIIKYHMGIYESEEFKDNFHYGNSEYSMKELLKQFNDDYCILFYFCDHMSSKYIEPKR